MSINLDVKTLKTGFWHMPKTFYAVLFIEFWERFAFYGIQATAIIYFIKQFGMLESKANVLVGSFFALAYAFMVAGGVIGDKWLGLRRSYLLGILFLVSGYGMLCIAPKIYGVYLALGLIVVGNMLFKTNATNYVSRCFEEQDPRLDAAYTYFYMSINLGSLSSIIIVPVISQAFGYSIGLSLMAIGMVIALISYFIFLPRLKHSDNQVGNSDKKMWLRMTIIVALGIVFAFVFSWLFRDLILCRVIMYSASVLILVAYLYLAGRLNHHEARGMYVALMLMLQSVIFWILYIQSATSMTLFALHNVRLSLFGYNIPAGSTQSLDPFFVILISPILANIYMWRSKKKGKDFSIPGKFALGLIFVSLCFMVLGVASQFFSDNNSQVSIFWLVLAFGLFALGELFVSAIGLSMIAQLLPKRYGGFGQGVWFLVTALGIQIGGQLSAFAAVDTVGKIAQSDTLQAYMALFYRLGVVTIIVGVMSIFLIKPTCRVIEQVKQHYS
ncbi:MAG: tppB [Burkholderiales bacterium]|jgi:POT family proton-dependent oligopeptide transporter|nr:tppB [Burkholderiales bacterium]